MPESTKSTAASAEPKSYKVRFLKNGMPWGFSYFKDDDATIKLTPERYEKMVDAGVITKL